MLKFISITKDFIDINKLNILAKEAFPPKESMPLAELIELNKRDDFSFLAIYDNNNFIGYIALLLYKELCYLFFLAIDTKYRGKGYGSLVIKMIMEKYSSKIHVVDFEAIDINAINNEQRIKRKKFYLANGYKETGLFLTYNDITYELVSSDLNFNFNTFKDMMTDNNIICDYYSK